MRNSVMAAMATLLVMVSGCGGQIDHPEEPRAQALAAQSITITLPVAAAQKLTFAMIANPLNHGGNTASEVLPSVPVGTRVYKWLGSAYQMNTLSSAGWSNPTQVLRPGEGFFIALPQATPNPYPLTFSGETPSNTLALPSSNQLVMLSSPLPRAGRLVTDLGFPVGPHDLLYRFDRVSQNFVAYSYISGVTWSPEEPRLEVGESFMLQRASAAPTSWTQTALGVSLTLKSNPDDPKSEVDYATTPPKVAGTVLLTCTPSTGLAVARVEYFRDDGVSLGTNSVAPYTVVTMEKPSLRFKDSGDGRKLDFVADYSI